MGLDGIDGEDVSHFNWLSCFLRSFGPVPYMQQNVTNTFFFGRETKVYQAFLGRKEILDKGYALLC